MYEKLLDSFWQEILFFAKWMTITCVLASAIIGGAIAVVVAHNRSNAVEVPQHMPIIE